MRIAYAISALRDFTIQSNKARSMHFSLSAFTFLHRLLKELTALCSLVSPIQIIAYISSYHPPGQSILRGRGHPYTLPICIGYVSLIRIRIVLSTDAYLVLFGHSLWFLSRVSILLLTRDIDIVILSVCLSETHWYCMKTAQHIVIVFFTIR